MAAYAAAKSQGESLFLGFGENAHNWIDGPDIDAAPSDSQNQTYAELMAAGGTFRQQLERNDLKNGEEEADANARWRLHQYLRSVGVPGV